MIDIDTLIAQHALSRILHHLSEDEQAKQPRYRVHSGAFTARAAARVIVKRKLAAFQQIAELRWQERTAQ